MATKNPTQWIPPNRLGSFANIGACFLVDNAGNFLVDNSGNFLVTTPIVVYPPNATAWTPTAAS